MPARGSVAQLVLRAQRGRTRRRRERRTCQSRIRTTKPSMSTVVKLGEKVLSSPVGRRIAITSTPAQVQRRPHRAEQLALPHERGGHGQRPWVASSALFDRESTRERLQQPLSFERVELIQRRALRAATSAPGRECPPLPGDGRQSRAEAGAGIGRTAAVVAARCPCRSALSVPASASAAIDFALRPAPGRLPPRAMFDFL